jgi:HAD superfamily hydrolase (TIGR01509 family)
MLRAIVFDFDGVIADTEPLHFRSLCDVLAEEHVALSEREYYARYLGYDDVGALRAIGVDYGRSWTIDHVAELVIRKAVRVEALERDVAVLFPGAEAAIRRAADAVPLAIASGALGAEIRRVLDRADLTRYFAAIVAAEDTPASKPAADPYQRAVLRLADAIGGPLRAADCVAIEDSRWGLESARAAGLRTVAISSSYDASDLGDADLVLPDIAALDVDTLRAIFDSF